MNFKKYIENQISEMVKYKWLKGEQLGHDPGDDAYNEWIEQYAQRYRDGYNDIFNEIVESVTFDVSAGIGETLNHNCSQEVIRELTKLIIEDFTKKWIEEKLKNPKNPHIDEI